MAKKKKAGKEKKTLDRVIMRAGKIAEMPLGFVMAGKHGWIFGLQDDYYEVGVVAPLMEEEDCQRLSEIIVNSANEAYTREMQSEIRREAKRGNVCYEYPTKVPSSANDVWVWGASREGIRKIKGMPQNRLLFSFEAPIPEHGGLARKFAEALEARLGEDSAFRAYSQKWRAQEKAEKKREKEQKRISSRTRVMKPSWYRKLAASEAMEVYEKAKIKFAHPPPSIKDFQEPQDDACPELNNALVDIFYDRRLYAAIAAVKIARLDFAHSRQANDEEIEKFYVGYWHLSAFAHKIKSEDEHAYDAEMVLFRREDGSNNEYRWSRHGLFEMDGKVYYLARGTGIAILAANEIAGVAVTRCFDRKKAMKAKEIVASLEKCL